VDVFESLKATALQVARETVAGHKGSMVATPCTVCILLGVRRDGKFHCIGELSYPYEDRFAANTAKRLAELCAFSGHDSPELVFGRFSAGIVEVGEAAINGHIHRLEVICTCAGALPQGIARFVAYRTARAYINAWGALMHQVEAGGHNA